MHASIRTTAVATAVIAGLLAGCGGPPSGGSATETEGADASASSAQSAMVASSDSPAVATVPTQLLHPWIRTTDPAPGFGTVHARSIFEFGPDEPKLSFGEFLPSSVARFDAARFTLSLDADGVGCWAGDVGNYTWSLSSTGRGLGIELIDDECGARGTALAGRWIKSDCPAYPDDFCLGDLDPGPHVSTFFTPRVPIDEWQFDRGAMAYEVPGGWANDYDAPDEFLLKPAWAVDSSGIYMWSEIAIVSGSAPCTPARDPTIPRTPKAMADWLTAQTALATSEPRAVTVGGLDGLELDLSVRPGASLPCLGDSRYFPVFVSPEGDGMQWGFSGHEKKRMYLLDLRNERTLVIEILGADEDAYRRLLPEATTIVESLEFVP